MPKGVYKVFTSVVIKVVKLALSGLAADSLRTAVESRGSISHFPLVDTGV